MVLEVVGQVFAGIETGLEFRVGDVACHNDGSVEAQTGGNGILGELFADVGHRLVEVYLHGVALAGIAHLFGNQFGGVVIELLNPDAVLVDLGLDVAVG